MVLVWGSVYQYELPPKDVYPLKKWPVMPDDVYPLKKLPVMPDEVTLSLLPSQMTHPLPDFVWKQTARDPGWRQWLNMAMTILGQWHHPEFHGRLFTNTSWPGICHFVVVVLFKKKKIRWGFRHASWWNISLPICQTVNKLCSGQTHIQAELEVYS